MLSANELEDRASRLKGAGKYPEALAVRLELERVLAEANAPDRDQASNLNMIAYLGACIGRLSDAERAARKSLEIYAPVAKDSDAVLATYTGMLAAVLAESRKFDEAAEYGEKALSLFAQSGHNTEFMKRRQADVARTRNRDCTQPYLDIRNHR
jgi:tetratricopeptide (TPR) repeat protein